VDEGTRRLLHRSSEYGYTTNPARALRAEPEAVSADTQDQLTLRSRRTARDAQLEEWRVRRDRIERELDWLHTQRFQRDVTTQARALRRQLDRIDTRLSRPALT
jgi:hypothetical protein